MTTAEDFYHYLSNTQAQTTVWRRLGTTPVLTCTLYNLRSPVAKAPPAIYKLIKPNIPNYPTDLYVDLRMRSDVGSWDKNRILGSVEVMICLDNDTPQLLQPFASQTPDNNPTPPEGLKDPYVDAPPRNRLNGWMKPNVRFIGVGARYTASSFYDGTSFNVDVRPVITPTATNADAQRLFNSPDLSFVVEGVVLNGTQGLDSSTPGQTYRVWIRENYESWIGIGSPFSSSYVDVPVYLMSPTA